MKNCPFCGEEIQDSAVRCKRCKEWLNAAPSQTIGVDSAGKTQQQVRHKPYNCLSVENAVFIIAFAVVLISNIAASRSPFPLAYGFSAAVSFLIIPIVFAVFYNIFSYIKDSSQSLRIVFIVINLIFALLYFSQSDINQAVNSINQEYHPPPQGRRTVFDNLYKNQEFLKKPREEQAKIMGQIDPNFAKLHPTEQNMFIYENVPAPKR